MSDKRVNQVHLAALGGLLHDIGKFSGRAGAGKREMTTKEALQEVVYEHALYSDSFVQEYVPEEIRRHLSAPRRHHNPQSEQDYRVQLADWLSSGEREEEEGPPVPYLLSVFARLKGHNARAYLPLGRLDPTGQGIFPREVEPGEWREEYRREYARLWDEFTADCQALQSESDLAVYLESIYHLLGEFAWCIPAAWYHTVPDVSLYDHARTTAAIAACLAADGRDVRWCQKVLHALKEKGGATSEEVCLLVVGDINGIQRFLYSIGSENAAKSLRGRSFYLQLLTEAVAHYLLDQLGLPTTNLLYAGGGNFYLIAPMTSKGRLAEAQAEVTRRLMEAHEGNLRLTLAWSAVQAHEFQVGVFAQAWDRLHNYLRRAKERPMAELDPAELAVRLGQGLGSGGNMPTCPVCGREEKGLTGDERCSFCTSLEELGRELAWSSHLVVMNAAATLPAGRVRTWRQGLEQFGFYAWLVSPRKEPESGRYLPGGPTKATLVRVHQLRGEPADETLLAEAGQKGPVVPGRPIPQLVPYIAREQRVVTFDELAAASTGIKRWGVLRMDGDNLGDLFRRGFARKENGNEVNYLSLSRVATLSFSLRLFFEGHLPTIGQRCDGGRLYLQYAGGDDLFVVGSWDALPRFATEVRREFARYVCQNPSVTLSGGISIHPERFPVYRAADEAEEAETQAKSLKRIRTTGPAGESSVQAESVEVEKDALSFLKVAVGWETFEEVQGLAEQLQRWISAGNAPMSLLQKIGILYREWAGGQQEALEKGWLKRGDFYYGPWIWHAAYQLGRTAAARGTHEEVRRAIYQWLKSLLVDRTLVVRLGLAARWAELLTRERGG